MQKKRGLVLVVVILVVMVFLILAASFVLRAIQEKTLAQREKERLDALNIAESCVDRALAELRNSFNWGGAANVVLANGEYTATIDTFGGSSTDRNILCAAYLPNQALAQVTRKVEAHIRKAAPDNFFTNAVYSVNKVDIYDNAEIEGDVRYANIKRQGADAKIEGTVTKDTTMPSLGQSVDFQMLHDVSQRQGNLYAFDPQYPTKLFDPDTGQEKVLPADFWHTRADDGVDNDNDGITDEDDEWVPKVVYIQAPSSPAGKSRGLRINGNNTIGGFLVLAGNVLNDPNENSYFHIELAGNTKVKGAIYVRKGGIWSLGESEIEGGIWVEVFIKMIGDSEVEYKSEYMDAIATNLGNIANTQIVSWRETN